MSERSISNAHLLFDEFLPSISNFQLNLVDHQEELLDKSFNSEELYPEPRNLSSSEFSELDDEPKDYNITRESLENTKTIKSTLAKNNRSEFGTNFKAKKNEAIPIKKYIFTPEQDKTILNLYKMFGGNWIKISSFMGGLRPNAVKNRFYKKLKDKHLKQDTYQKDISKLSNEKLETKLECTAEKTTQLVNLYQKVIEIENYIKNTKIQIRQLVKQSIEIPKSEVKHQLDN